MPLRIQQHIVPRHRRQHIIWRRHLGFGSSQRGSVRQGTFPIALGLASLIIVTLLAFFYLQQVLHTASQGTDIHELESRLVELRERQRELELEGATLRSLQTVENRVQKLNLVKTDQVTYLAPEAGLVAAAAD